MTTDSDINVRLRRETHARLARICARMQEQASISLYQITGEKLIAASISFDKVINVLASNWEGTHRGNKKTGDKKPAKTARSKGRRNPGVRKGAPTEAPASGEDAAG